MTTAATKQKRGLWFDLLVVAIVLSVVALPIALFCFLNADWVSDATIARLPNATREEVQQMLGEPDHRDPDCWCYTRPWRIAEFQVYFDFDGRVKEWWYDR